MKIDVPGYNTTVEFPDSMPTEEVRRIMREKFPPKSGLEPAEEKAVVGQSIFADEPVPFDIESQMYAADTNIDPKDVSAALLLVVRPFLATGYTTAAAVNRGIAGFALHLDAIADYLGQKTGTEKGGIFGKAAKTYQENTEYWQKRAEEVGVSFLEELFGEALGGAVPGVAEFALNIPYAALSGAALAKEKGRGEIAGALTEAAKRGVLGAVFHAMGPLKQYLRAPAMGSVFGFQAASEGADAKEIAKAAGAGVLFSMASPGGKMGLNEMRRNLEMEIVRKRAEEVKPAEEMAKEQAAPPAEQTPGETSPLETGKVSPEGKIEAPGAKSGEMYWPESAEARFMFDDMKSVLRSSQTKTVTEVEGETMVAGSAYPQWFRDLSKKHKISADETVKLIDKYLSGKKELTDRQANIFGDVVSAAMAESRTPYYRDLIQVDAVKMGAQGAAGAGAMAMAPEAGFRRQPASVSGKAEDPIARRSDLVRFLTEKLDIPIRTGRFRDKALGIFKIKDEVIRTGKANDIEVISHEIGHALHKFLYPESVTATGLSSHPFSAFKGELEPIATKPKAGQDVVPEGFAEFVRLYVTNPKKAQEKAPAFFPHFEHLLEAKSPESLEILLAARNHYQKWLEQPAQMRIRAQISVGEKTVKPETSRFDDFYTAMVDDLYPLKSIVEEMAKGREIRTAENPYELARLFRGWTGKAEAFLKHSPFKFNTYENVGKPLQEILRPVEGRLDDFRDYVVSKRAIELDKRGVETGILKQDAAEVVAKYEKEFGKPFDELKEFQNHALEYLRDSGVLDKKVFAQIRAANEDYVPFYRIMDEGKGAGGYGVGLEARNPIKKIKGSWRDIQDPLESVIKNTYLYINMAEKNAVGKALVDLAKSGEGLGKFVEKIPTPMQGVKITPEELTRLGLENVPEDAVSVFRPSSFVPQDNVISVFKDGKRELYQVHPEIARSFKALDKEDLGMITRLLAYPASWLRAGATLTPEFIARNPIRDQWTAFVLSKYGFAPGFDLARGIFHLAKKDEAYWEWKKGGGDNSMLVSMDRDYLQDNLGELLQKYPVQNLIKNPINALRLLSELGEAGTRIGEFARGTAKEGRTKAGIQAAALAARDVTLDFGRKGAKGKAINAITAFWNAQVQGSDRMVRAFKDDPVITSARIAASITIPSILLAIANHDDPRVKEIPQWQKDLFWLFPTENHVWRIPKPFEMGILFGSVPERITRYILDQDPHAFDGLLETIGRGFSPGVLPTASIPLIENWANKSTFFDRPIVPQNRTELMPEYQYGAHTSETAKQLGKVLGRLPWVDQIAPPSPARIENLIRGWTGGLGMHALSIADAGLRAAGVTQRDYEKPAATLSDIPFVKAFHVRYPSASAESIQRFYENHKEIDQTVKTAKVLIEKENRPEEALKLLEDGNLENLNGMYESMRNIHDLVDKVWINPSMSADEKREFIDGLYMQMIEIAAAGNSLVDTMKAARKEEKKERREIAPTAPGPGERPVSFD